MFKISLRIHQAAFPTAGWTMNAQKKGKISFSKNSNIQILNQRYVLHEFWKLSPRASEFACFEGLNNQSRDIIWSRRQLYPPEAGRRRRNIWLFAFGSFCGCVFGIFVFVCVCICLYVCLFVFYLYLSLFAGEPPAVSGGGGGESGIQHSVYQHATYPLKTFKSLSSPISLLNIANNDLFY